MDDVATRIRESLERLTASPSFVDWMALQRPQPRDLVLVNNSFALRDVKTTKSDKFLVVTLADDLTPTGGLSVGTGLKFNLDFKLLSANSTNLPSLRSLEEAIAEERSVLGSLVFILIGTIDDTVILMEPLNHSAFAALLWNPAQGDLLTVDVNQVVVRETHDEDAVWQEMQRHYQLRSDVPPSGLRESLALALEKLQGQAVAKLQLPPFQSTPADGITDQIISVLQQQRQQYSDALAQMGMTGEAGRNAFNEVLRIAYNFAADATAYLRLMVSICDLKPIVLWGTIAEHHALSESFLALPWTGSRSKASLKGYRDTIADARNSAFHHLFPFQKTLSVDLPDTALRGAELRFFSEYTRKGDNTLSYRDKELVEILLDFTRARDRRVPSRFWHLNLAVMDRAITMFEQTSSLIKLLNS